jgi:transcriptional regulator with XRE-family HTH domain
MNVIFKDSLPGIAERLHKVRKQLNMTVDMMAKATGLSKAIIYEAERGMKKPSSAYLFGLNSFFKVNLNYIMTGEGEMFLAPGKDMLIVSREDEELFELVDMIKKSKLVRYGILGYFFEYKMKSKGIIDAQLEELRIKEQREKGGG